MTDINEAKSTVSPYWSKAWTWVGDHPKTTIVISAVVIALAVFIR